jgi:hypothetical protein
MTEYVQLIIAYVATVMAILSTSILFVVVWFLYKEQRQHL